MSIVFHYEDGTESYCETVKDLETQAPFRVDIPDIPGVEDGNCCLCPLDLETIAKQKGYRISREGPDGEFDPFAYHWYPKGV